MKGTKERSGKETRRERAEEERKKIKIKKGKDKEDSREMGDL